MAKNVSLQCSLPNCSNQVVQTANSRRKKEYCSNACRQKAYRLRKPATPKRNKQLVTISNYAHLTGLLTELPVDQLHDLRERITAVLQERNKNNAEEPFLYFRKGSGVVHLAVSRNVTICGRPTDNLTQLQPSRGEKTCSYCSKIRERGTWWKTWRKEFGDGGST